MAEDLGTANWIIVELSALRLWFPEEGVSELSAQLSEVRVADPAEEDWEPGALLPGDTWRALEPVITPRMDLNPVFQPARDAAVVPLRPPGDLEQLGEVDRSLGAQYDTPGVLTRTQRGPDLPALGLHLDNWDRLPARRRRDSRNRACLNLGPEARSLLLVDLDLLASCGPEQVPDTDLGRALAARAPTPPRVVRVRVPPGWAYVAPTELLLHDAQTLEQRREGTTCVTALGRFAPTASSAWVVRV